MKCPYCNEVIDYDERLQHIRKHNAPSKETPTDSKTANKGT